MSGIEYFSEGGFRVVEAEDEDLDGERANSWISHVCAEFAKERSLDEVSGIMMNSELRQEKCAFCLTEIPPSVIALWKLHNWGYEL